MSYQSPPPSDQYPNQRRGPRRLTPQEAEEVYQARRSDSVGYQDSAFGRTIFDVENPLDYDPDLRRQVYSEMGASLRTQLQTQRGLPPNQRVHVERSASPNPNSPATIREARQLMNRATAQQPQYDDEDDDDWFEEDDEPDEDYDSPELYPAPARSSRRPQRQRDPYEDLEPAGPPPRATQARRLPPQQPPPRRQPRQQAPAPVRQLATRQPQRQPPADPRRDTRRAPVQPVARQTLPVRSVEPSRPDLLGPDGTIPRNPCGQPFYTRIGTGAIVVECMEERRSERPPYHIRMPHIARINDPTANGTGYFIWYYPGEEPR